LEDRNLKNVDMKLGGKILTIKVDLAQDHGPSKSGKTIIIATTEGNAPIPGGGGAIIGLNIYRGR